MTNHYKRLVVFTILFFPATVWVTAQGPIVSTAPQVVAGVGLGFEFVTVITLQNTFTGPCGAEILLHRGPGQTVDVDLLVNGEALVNPLNLQLAALAAQRLRITATSGLFQGAARITDNCRGLSVTAGFDIVPDTGVGAIPAAATQNPPEIFNYSPSLGAKLHPGTVGRAVVDIDPQGNDGLPNNPGLAMVLDPDLPSPLEVLFCQRVSDSLGNPQTHELCDSIDGTHVTLNLTDTFPDIRDLNDATWEFLVQGPGQQNVQANVLVIDVTSPNQFRGVPVTVFNPACDPDGLCLNNDRFEVTIDAFTGTVQSNGEAEQTDESSGFFFFPGFGSNNFEMLVNVIDGCKFNQHFWVFASSATDVEYTLEVTDTVTGQSKTYDNELGNPAPAITDTQAFATCP